MNPSLTEFRDKCRELLLDLVWRQWSALGVPGHTAEAETRIVDPEALLIFTCTIGRHEPRLFDAMLDWLAENGRFINVQRLKRILRTETFVGERVLTAVAGRLAKGAEAPKWRQLAKPPARTEAPEPLFFAPDGQSLPLIGEPERHFARYGFTRGPLRQRGHSKPIRPSEPATLTLQLRALLGINIRSEIVMYLLTHASAHPAAIAREAGYSVRAVQNTLADMSQSGVVQLRVSQREKHYWVRSETWGHLLQRPTPFPKWTTWPPFFSAWEQIWLGLNAPRLPLLDPLLQASELRQLMKQVRPSLERAGFDKTLSDDRQHLGESYLPVFLEDVMRLLR